MTTGTNLPSQGSNRKSRRNRRNLVPFTFASGAAGFIDAKTIPADAWTSHHGVSNRGKQVNSLGSVDISGSNDMLIRKDNGFVVAIDKDELDVLMKQRGQEKINVKSI